MGSRVATGGALLALAMLVALVLAWSLQRRLIYFPYPVVPPAAGVLPGSEEVAFDTEDRLRLRGWFLPASGGDGGAVLVCNGNGGNPGRPSEAGLAADTRAAHAWLAARAGVDPGRVAYYGESLGAAVALGLAIERPPAALVLRSPFTSLADVAQFHYPWLPVRLLLAERYPSLDRVRHLAVPLLVVAGERDAIVPASQSRRLYDAAREPKRFTMVPGADHNDEALLSGGHLIGEVLGFLRETPVLARSAAPPAP